MIKKRRLGYEIRKKLYLIQRKNTFKLGTKMSTKKLEIMSTLKNNCKLLLDNELKD